MALAGRTVLVTGASGFIASHVVKGLLEKGCDVHATVRNPQSQESVAHLLSLPGADQHLKLFQADLLQPACFQEAIKGCDGVLHMATPVIHNAEDGEKEMYEPGMKGLESILAAMEEVNKEDSKIKTFVLTSSVAAMAPLKEPSIKDESTWSDVKDLRARSRWYALTKTAQELRAQEWASVHKDTVRYVSINPTMVYGPVLGHKLNAGMTLLAKWLNEGMEKVPDDTFSFVSVFDCADMHVSAYEREEVSGRFLCAAESLHFNDILAKFKALHSKMPDFTPVESSEKIATQFDHTRMKILCPNFRDTDTIFKDAYQSLVGRNVI